MEDEVDLIDRENSHLTDSQPLAHHRSPREKQMPVAQCINDNTLIFLTVVIWINLFDTVFCFQLRNPPPPPQVESVVSFHMEGRYCVPYALRIRQHYKHWHSRPTGGAEGIL